jgi:ABC-type amino acid transport system permease subunit
MNAFIAIPIATAVGVGITAVVLAASSSPRRARWLLGNRIARFASVPEDVLDTELSRAARSAFHGVEAGALVLLLILYIRCMPIVADALARAPFWIAVSGLIATVGAGAFLAYLEFAWIRAAILRRLDRRFAERLAT